jgi:hypothetical protein
MKRVLLALSILALAPSALAQDRGAWRINSEKPAAVLRAEPRGVLRILCDRPSQKLTITISSAVRVRKGDRPRREVFVGFDGVEERETWLWGYRDRTVTLTRDFAVEPFLEKLATAKKLAISVTPHKGAQVHFHFAPAGAAQALAELRAACSAPSPSVP